MRKIGATYRVRTDDLYLEKERYRNIKSTNELMLIEYLIMGRFRKLERHIGFEPMTYTLARYRSTN